MSRELLQQALDAPQAEPVAHFINTAPQGQKPHWEQVADEHANDPDVQPLYTTPPAPQASPATPVVTMPFQSRVSPWMQACFGDVISRDTVERNHRFLEESLELVQSCGCTQHEAHQLVDYVYGRPVGEPLQEVGGVMVTLAALCLAQGLDMHDAGETELARIWTKVEQIRAKQAAKPKHSPLPATPVVREPLTDAQIDAIWNANDLPEHRSNLSPWGMDRIRAIINAAHGITGGSK